MEQQPACDNSEITVDLSKDNLEPTASTTAVVVTNINNNNNNSTINKINSDSINSVNKDTCENGDDIDTNESGGENTPKIVDAIMRRRTPTSPFHSRQKRLRPAYSIPHAGKFWFAHVGWKRTHGAALVGYLIGLSLLLGQCLTPAVYFTMSRDKAISNRGHGGFCGDDSYSQTCHKIVLKLFSKTFHLYFLYLTVFQVLLVMTCFGLTSWKFFTRNKMEKFCLQQARIVFDVILTLTSCTKAYFAHSTEQMLAQDSELMGLDCHTGSSLELTLVTILIFFLLAGESRVILFYCHNIHSLRQFLQDFEIHQLMFQAANK